MLSVLPMIPPKFGIKIIDQASIKRQMETIAMLIGRCDEVINCGDAGQEGRGDTALGDAESRMRQAREASVGQFSYRRGCP